VTAPQALEVRVTDPSDAGKRVDTLVAERLGLFTRSQARQRIQSLTLNGHPTRLGRKVQLGDVVSVVCTELPPLALAAQDIPLAILFENPDVIVVDKRQGMVVHPGSGNRDGTLVNALLYHCAALSEAFGADTPRPGIVHRLDKDTSGIIITAKNARAHEFLAAQFKDRTVRKRYVAIVKGKLPAEEGRVETRLARDPRNRQRFAVVPTGGKLAVTRYRVLLSFTLPGPRETDAPESYSLVLCVPRTGRTHQLRVHLRHAGAWILGDELYGRSDPRFPDATLMLHARSLAVKLPGEAAPRVFVSPMPDRFRSVLQTLQSFSPR
jgi:23S rRNA pseudouridine1911/1915/1917 synthase